MKELLPHFIALLIVTPDYPDNTNLYVSCTQEKTIEQVNDINRQKINSNIFSVYIPNKLLCDKKFRTNYRNIKSSKNVKYFLKQLSIKQYYANMLQNTKDKNLQKELQKKLNSTMTTKQINYYE